MQVRKAAAGAIAFAGMSAALALAAAAQAPLQPGDRQITVSPSTGLVDGQTVTVEWTGYTPNSKVTVIQCADGAGLKPETCNTSSALFDQDAGPDGQGSVDLVVHTGDTGPDGECSASGNNECVIAANEDLRDGITAIAPISFAEGAAPAAPAATPSSELAETGVSSMPLAVTGTASILAGLLVVRTARRRRQPA
jgi:hypothetical protein